VASGAGEAARRTQWSAARCRECPPASADDELGAGNDKYGSRPREVVLRQRLRSAALSVYEPDPMRAIQEAEAKPASPAP